MLIKQSSAGVVIYSLDDDGSRAYLLLQYPRGPWDFAKGKLTQGEPWRVGALRESKEETGLSLILHPTFEHAYSYTFNDSRGNKIEKTVVFFLAKADRDSAVTLSYEHVDYLWLPYHQARMQLQFENIRYLLDQVEQFLELSAE
jgi:8-oxo-dGTP pyrophosphatase MutT (NUDIX family)